MQGGGGASHQQQQQATGTGTSSSSSSVPLRDPSYIQRKRLQNRVLLQHIKKLSKPIHQVHLLALDDLDEDGKFPRTMTAFLQQGGLYSTDLLFISRRFFFLLYGGFHKVCSQAFGFCFTIIYLCFSKRTCFSEIFQCFSRNISSRKSFSFQRCL